MWFTELPSRLRGEAWKVASGNNASLSKELYEIMKFKACRFADTLRNKNEIEKRGRPEGDPHYVKMKTDLETMMAMPGRSHEDSMTIIENDLP